MGIRAATIQDSDNIKDIYWSAFSENERECVSNLAADLLSENTTPETISLIAETDGLAVGHIAFSPVSLDNNEKIQGYILAPLGVKPEYQHHRIGSTLIESGIHRLSVEKVNIIFVYGDPNYYSRFGFNTNTALPYVPPYPLQYPSGWQALLLNTCHPANLSVPITCVTSLLKPALW
jgi:putative acetyltransferase